MLEDYLVELLLWNDRIQLVGPGHVPDLKERVTTETGLLLRGFPKDSAIRWADIGSGGGLPAIPVLLADRSNRLQLTLVEADGRKAAFLRHALRSVHRSAEVTVGRIEDIGELRADVITARALAPLDRLVALAERHLAPLGRLLALKGRGAEAEIAAFRRVRDAEIVTYAGPGDLVLVQISNIVPHRTGASHGP